MLLITDMTLNEFESACLNSFAEILHDELLRKQAELREFGARHRALKEKRKK